MIRIDQIFTQNNVQMLNIIRMKFKIEYKKSPKET